MELGVEYRCIVCYKDAAPAELFDKTAELAFHKNAYPTNLNRKGPAGRNLCRLINKPTTPKTPAGR